MENTAHAALPDEEIIAALARGLAVDSLTGAQILITAAILAEAARQLSALRDAGLDIVRAISC